MIGLRTLLGLPPKVSAQRAAELAKEYSAAQGWKWESLVAVNSILGRWLVRTNLPKVKEQGGESIELYVDKSSGKISGTGLITRASKNHPEHFGPEIMEVYPNYLTESEDARSECGGNCFVPSFLRRPKISEEQARVIARNACIEQGWPADKMAIHRRGGSWEIITNFPMRGGNARLEVDCFTGKILSGGFARR